MKKEDKITLSEWDELTGKGKEVLQTWAMERGYELDLIPSSSGTFDPACDYAALLTYDQMIEYMQEHNQDVPSASSTEKNCRLLWKRITRLLSS